MGGQTGSQVRRRRRAGRRRSRTYASTRGAPCGAVATPDQVLKLRVLLVRPSCDYQVISRASGGRTTDPFIVAVLPVLGCYRPTTKRRADDGSRATTTPDPRMGDGALALTLHLPCSIMIGAAEWLQTPSSTDRAARRVRVPITASASALGRRAEDGLRAARRAGMCLVATTSRSKGASSRRSAGETGSCGSGGRGTRRSLPPTTPQRSGTSASPRP